jgi:hypothetical protein
LIIDPGRVVLATEPGPDMGRETRRELAIQAAAIPGGGCMRNLKLTDG